MFGPKVVEVANSKISGRIEVRRIGRSTYVTTSGLTQSGGLINQLWGNTLKRLPKRDLIGKSWLVLGLATGTVAKLISTKYSPKSLVGVELDPVMLSLGETYFQTSSLPQLTIVKQDAYKYLLSTKLNFDWIIIDTYVGERLPEFVYDPKFITQVKKKGRRAIFNHLFYDADKRAKAELLTSRINSVFDQVQLIRELTNLLLVCS